MFNANWSSNQNSSTSNVDWSALADTWMQQREQQAQWQQVILPPPPPPPPPPAFLLTGPPIPPPGPPPIGMTFPPLPPSPMLLTGHHHQQLQVGSNTTQESFTMTNIENSQWRPSMPGSSSLPLPPPPPPAPSNMMAPSGTQWRPNSNLTQPLFPVQPEMSAHMLNRNYWPANANNPPMHTNHVPPTLAPPPPPLPPAPPSLQQKMTPSYQKASFANPSTDKRLLNSSANSTIPSLMDLVSSSYGSVPSPTVPPVAPVSSSPIVSKSIATKPATTPTNGNANRSKIPVWLREELNRIEKEKEKKLRNQQNQSISQSNNDSRSKFNDESDGETLEESRYQKKPGIFSDDPSEDEDQNLDRSPTRSPLISSTPLVPRRSRFDDDQPTDKQLNASRTSRKSIRSPSSPHSRSSDSVEEEEEEDANADETRADENFDDKLRRTFIELLCEVIDDDLASLAKEVYLQLKAETSKPVILKAPGLTSLIQSVYGSDSSDSENNTEPVSKDDAILKSDATVEHDLKNAADHSPKKPSHDDEQKSKKAKKKKLSRERSRSSSSSSSNRHRSSKTNHHKKKERHHRRYSSSSSSPSPSRSYKKSKTSSTTHGYHKSKSSDHHGKKR